MSPRTRAVLLKFLLVGSTSFGGGRSTYLHHAFVRSGWIPEEVFLRDFAMAQVLPGPNFSNTSLLCGLRLGGLRLGLAGWAALMLPGCIAMIVAMTLVSGADPTMARALHGVIAGAAGVITATALRLVRTSVRSAADGLAAVAAFVLMVLGVPLLVTLAVAGGFGVWARRAQLRGKR